MLYILNEAGPLDGEALTDVSIRVGKNRYQRDFSWTRAGRETLLRYMASDAWHLDPSCVLMAGEVVSRSSVRRDYVEKFEIYERARIPTYMIIDLNLPRCPYVQHFVLGDDGRYRLECAAGPGEAFTISHPFKITFDPAVLLDGPVRFRSTLQQLS
jgi:Uma2 family endonuclease